MSVRDAVVPREQSPGQALRREAQAITRLSAVGSGDVELAVRELGGGRTIRFAPSHNLPGRKLVAIAGQSKVVIGSPKGGVTVHRTFESKLDLVDVRRFAASAAHVAHAAMAAAMKAATTLPFAGATVAEAALAAQLKRQALAEIRGKTLADLLALIGELEEFDPQKNPAAFEARMLLPKLLAHDPKALAQVASLLDGEFGPQGKTLLTALGEAGTPAAQKILADVLIDGQRTSDMRMTAIMSFVQTDRPSVDSARALARVLADDDVRVVQGALCMLGGVAGRIGSDSARREAFASLAAMAARRGDDPRWQRAYLVALGNSGHASVYASVQPHLRSGDGHMRQSAVRALRRVTSPQARSQVLAVLGSDPSPLVRAEAIEAIGRRRDGAAFAKPKG